MAESIKLHSLGSPLSWDLQSRMSLPKAPGVYWYKSDDKTVLYVGKAKNLRNRLLSYRHTKNMLTRTRQMVQQIDGTFFHITDNELEALLLEAELVKTHQPRYNVRLKDDKSPLYILLTSKPFPQIKAVRKTQSISLQKNKLYGPYPSAYQVTKILKLCRSIFGYCNATESQVRRQQPCFYYHIKKCPGYCAGDISLEEYDKHMMAISLFLQGKKHRLKRTLTSAITSHAQAQEYEQAHKLKSQLEAFMYISKHYRGDSEYTKPIPQLHDDFGIDSCQKLFRILKKHLPLPPEYQLHRIETYDVSNIQGRQATASMVVFVNGYPDKSQYRHFKIHTLNRPNDVGMLRETLERRQKHSDWGIPSLIIIDGGKSQLNMARQSVLWTIPVVSIAKRPDRLLIPLAHENGGGIMSIQLQERDLASDLLRRMRDESHRFAKRLHKKLHYKHIVLDS